jgi:hypothetical protein
MALGSGFDAFVKSWLHRQFYGSSSEYSLNNLFQSQVEEHVQDEVWEHSKFIFNLYLESGALWSLYKEMEGYEPQFEVGLSKTVDGVPIFGKPDLCFIKTDLKVVYDFKVNGFFSAGNTSPMKGYVWCWDANTKQICSHKHHEPMDYKGVTINSIFLMEQCDKKWADQLAMYSWLVDGPEDCVVGIEQIVGRPEKIRICKHRLLLGKDWMLSLKERLKEAWDAVVNETVIPPEELATMCGPQTKAYTILDLMK